MRVMNNLKSKFKKANKDNKGFSLVELIIVIAIMAILVGIVGTQVIPYIDKSRNAKDIQVLSGLCTDATAAYSSNAANLDASATYVITIGKSAAAGAADAISVTGGTTAEQTTLKNAFVELNSATSVSNLKLESKAGKAIKTITITCKNTDPMVTVETTLDDGSTQTNFAKIESK